jgi:predicted O-methyltransferase YrrM
MSNRTLNMTDSLSEYLLEHSMREDPVAARLRERTAAIPEHNMQIAPEQGQFMALLAHLMGARRAIEVGVFTGYSSLSVARALGPDGFLLACDVSEEWTALARESWAEAGVAERIELVIAPAAQTLAARLDAGEAASYDLAFIDADKANYEIYYEHCLALIRPGGLVMLDNVLWGGAVSDPEVVDEDTVAIRAINLKLHADPRVEIAMLPIADGLTLALKR